MGELQETFATAQRVTYSKARPDRQQGHEVGTGGHGSYLSDIVSTQSSLEMEDTWVATGIDASQVIPAKAAFLQPADQGPLQQVSASAVQPAVTGRAQQIDSRIPHCRGYYPRHRGPAVQT